MRHKILVLVAMGAFALCLRSMVSAQSDSSSSLHAGDVAMKNPEEKKLFERLLCQCGDCARLPLSTCACGWADDMRKKLRMRLSAGETLQVIQASYREEFGPKAIAIPSDKGLDRALWAVPIAVFVLAGFALVSFSRRWRMQANRAAEQAPAKVNDPSLDARLDDELNKL